MERDFTNSKFRGPQETPKRRSDKGEGLSRQQLRRTMLGLLISRFAIHLKMHFPIP